MADARIEKLARVMVNYSLDLQPGQKFWLRTTPLAEELNLAVYEEAIQAGAKDFVVKPFQPSRVLEAVQRVLG